MTIAETVVIPLLALHQAGEHTSAQLAELFGAARSTVYRGH